MIKRPTWYKLEMIVAGQEPVLKRKRAAEQPEGFYKTKNEATAAFSEEVATSDPDMATHMAAASEASTVPPESPEVSKVTPGPALGGYGAKVFRTMGDAPFVYKGVFTAREIALLAKTTEAKVKSGLAECIKAKLVMTYEVSGSLRYSLIKDPE